mmetsp:Transcript_29285/g.64566  ORF Transcript_29285/g.64566 Transcript_29285/m.64566 type:complete len:89 (+) Transcript_29285:1471-1737(+)
MDVRKATSLVEVGHEEAGEYLTQESDAEDEPLPNDCAITKVADGNLKSDGGREEDSHQPLKDALELPNEDVMEFVAATEGKTGDEGTH